MCSWQEGIYVYKWYTCIRICSHTTFCILLGILLHTGISMCSWQDGIYAYKWYTCKHICSHNWFCILLGILLHTGMFMCSWQIGIYAYKWCTCICICSHSIFCILLGILLHTGIFLCSWQEGMSVVVIIPFIPDTWGWFTMTLYKCLMNSFFYGNSRLWGEWPQISQADIKSIVSSFTKLKDTNVFFSINIHPDHISLDKWHSSHNNAMKLWVYSHIIKHTVPAHSDIPIQQEAIS